MNKPNINVRLIGVEFSNIKNVLRASINFPIEKDIDKNGRNNIFGIYGPNGSGKTSLIDCLSILKSLICEIPLDKKTYDVINTRSLEATLIFKFNIDVDSIKYYVEYTANIEKFDDIFLNNPLTAASLKSETIKYRSAVKDENGKSDNLKTLISIDLNSNIDREILKPYDSYKQFLSDTNNYSSVVKLSVSAKATHKSFIFSKNFINSIRNSKNINPIIFKIINQLKLFGMINLFVVDQVNNNNISLNLGFRHIDENSAGTSFGQINITNLTAMTKNEFTNYKESISEANNVLKTLIPGLSVDTCNEREILLPNGMQGTSFQLASFRNGVQIPFSCESNGIRSIFSVLSLIVAAYNNPSVCIAIDEFDAGVFEHLLGTIVKVYSESGKGLFIFTSHNLRPLEILRRNNIFFTTKEHYLFDTSRYIPKDFNRRNNYLRAMSLDNDDFFQVNQAKGFELRSALGGNMNDITK